MFLTKLKQRIRSLRVPKGEMKSEESEELSNITEIIKKSKLIANENPARYHLQKSIVNSEKCEPYRKITFEARDRNKPHKSILLVGETGTGKTTLINTIINYMLGVKREDKVWFEITDDQSDRSSAHSQTSFITVYEFYLQESPIDLTIIDTPGYGDTRGIDLDKEIPKSLLRLSQSAEGIHEIDVVCLVMKAAENRLSERQIYIFDAVQSLFGRDIAENIVLLLTHSTGAPPKNALTAVKEAKIKCAVNDQDQPVFFQFNNCQSDAVDEEYDVMQGQSWNLSLREMEGLFDFLENIKPKTLKMTQDVLQKWQQLNAIINNLKSRFQFIELKQNELKQNEAALEEFVKTKKDFEYEVDVTYKEKVRATSQVLCCNNCKENCQYEDGSWLSSWFWSSVIVNNYCTVCTKKCHKNNHESNNIKYVIKTKKEEIRSKAYDKLLDKYNKDSISVKKKFKEDLKEYEEEKKKLLNEAFDCVETLQKIALNTDSLIMLQHIDFLIEKLKDTKEMDDVEKLQKLKIIKKRAEEQK